MKACVCLVAWHGNPGLFEQLAGLVEIDLFVISHRPPGWLPGEIQRYVAPEKIFYPPNLGYDWGAYQQFIQGGFYRDYPYVFFMHDDVHVLDAGIFQACIDLIRSRGEYSVVGNGRQTQHRSWPRTHIQSYAHSRWKPPSWEFCHDAVRGSFLATSAQLLQKLGDLEILWDRRGYWGVGAGNWSLRASCGKIEHLFGEGTFQYLSETYLSSPFLEEMQRGEASIALDAGLAREAGLPRQAPSLAFRLRFKLLVGLCRGLMTGYMNARTDSVRQAFRGMMRILFHDL